MAHKTKIFISESRLGYFAKPDLAATSQLSSRTCKKWFIARHCRACLRTTESCQTHPKHHTGLVCFPRWSSAPSMPEHASQIQPLLLKHLAREWHCACCSQNYVGSAFSTSKKAIAVTVLFCAHAPFLSAPRVAQMVEGE